jgi:multidrug transporter EmrE-like cation transporter
MGYFYVLLTVAFTVYGQLILKYEVNRVVFPPDGIETLYFVVRFCFRPLVFSGLCAAVLASFAWMAALSKFELSYAYPFMSLNFVLVVMISMLAFGETFNLYKLAGLALIVSGVLLLGAAGRT